MAELALQRAPLALSGALDRLAAPLEDALVALFYDGESAAVAAGNSICLVGGGARARSELVLVQRPEAVTALAWVDVYQTKRVAVLLAGYESGVVRCFDERGRLLLSQLLHREAVRGLRLCIRSRFNRVGGDLLVLFASALCCVDGATLLGSIRAKLEAADAPPQPPPAAAAAGVGADARAAWAYRKWALSQQAKVCDALLCGELDPYPFGLEQTATLASATTLPRFVACGQDPFLAFYAPLDGGGPSLTAVALAATLRTATRVLTDMFSFARGLLWSGGGDAAAATAAAEQQRQQQQQQQEGEIDAAQVSVEAPQALAFQRSLRDQGRCATAMEAAPGLTLAALVDSFGRVMVVDLAHFLVVRLLKGYREAQVAWLAPRGRPPALLVYVPSRGLLEAWRPYGKRVAALDVGSGATLLQTTSVQPRSNADAEAACWLLRPDGAVARVTLSRSASSAAIAMAMSSAAAAQRARPAARARGAPLAVRVLSDAEESKSDGERQRSGEAAAEPVAESELEARAAEWAAAVRRAWMRPRAAGPAAAPAAAAAAAAATRLPPPPSAEEQAALHAQFTALLAAATRSASVTAIDRALFAADGGAVPVGHAAPSAAAAGGGPAASAAAAAAGAAGASRAAALLCAPGYVHWAMQLLSAGRGALDPRVRALQTRERGGGDAGARVELQLLLVLRTRLSCVGHLLHALDGVTQTAAARVQQAESEVKEAMGEEALAAARARAALAPVTLQPLEFLASFSLAAFPAVTVSLGTGMGAAAAAAAAAPLQLRLDLSLAERTRLATGLFGHAQSAEEASGTLAHLKLSALSARAISKLFFVWLATLRSPAAMAPDPASEMQKRTLALWVRALHAELNQAAAAATAATGAAAIVDESFREAVTHWCERTSLFDHGIALTRLCAQAEREEGGAAANAEWAAQLESRLATLQMVRSYLPGLDHSLITLANLAGDWPIARLVAAQLCSGIAPRAPPQSAARGAARAAESEFARPPDLEVTMKTLELAAAAQETVSREGLSAGVHEKSVQAVRHLLSKDFGFSGDRELDRQAVLFYCALHIFGVCQHGGASDPDGALLLHLMDHVEALSRGAVAGGLALCVWNNLASAHVEAVVASLARAAAEDALAAAASTPQGVLGREWGLSEAHARNVMAAAARSLRFLRECLEAHRSHAEQKSRVDAEEPDMVAVTEHDVHDAAASHIMTGMRALFGELLRSARLPLERSVDYLVQLCETMNAAATYGLPLRSSKPHYAIGELFPLYARVDHLVRDTSEALSALKSSRLRAAPPNAASPANAAAEPKKVAPWPQLSTEQQQQQSAARLEFVSHLFRTRSDVPGAWQEAFRLATILGVPIDVARRRFALILFARNQDQRADELLLQIADKAELLPALLSVAFARFGLSLKVAYRNPRVQEHVQASVPGEYWAFLVAQEQKGAWRPPSLEVEELPYTIEQTLGVLQRVQFMLSQQQQQQQQQQSPLPRALLEFHSKLLQLTERVKRALDTYRPPSSAGAPRP